MRPSSFARTVLRSLLPSSLSLSLSLFFSFCSFLLLGKERQAFPLCFLGSRRVEHVVSRRTAESKIKESCWLGIGERLSMCQLLPDAYVLSPIAYFFPELLKVEDLFEFLSPCSAFPRSKEKSVKKLLEAELEK